MKGPGVLVRKWGMLILDEVKGHLTPETKATITGSSMNTYLWGGLITAGARCCGEQTIPRPHKAAV
jgi:hypothetical protein